MQDRASTTNPEPPAGAPPTESLAAVVERAWPAALWRDVGVAVAVSGGPDSVALLVTLAERKRSAGGRGELAVVHYDHATRGGASHDDARWVGELAAGLGLRLETEASSSSDERSEERLREERRDFYRRAVGRLGARYLATAHHADDQAETVLFRLLRGTGLRGAAGIRPTAPLTPACTLVRPMLAATRSQVLAALAARNQPYRTDATNADPDASTRNWLRQRVLPLVAERFPQASAGLGAFASQAAETADLIESLAQELLDRAAGGDDVGGARLYTAPLREAPPGLALEALRLAWRRAGLGEQGMTSGSWRRLLAVALTERAPASEMLAGGVVALCDGVVLVLKRPREGDASC